MAEWDVQHGDRRTELVCIGRHLEHGAASKQLETCLLTAEEMGGGQESWLLLSDPWAKDFAGRGGQMVSGVSEANLRRFMEVITLPLTLPLPLPLPLPLTLALTSENSWR
jgi:hypothetical protein